MALIQCPECGQTISDKAGMCPKCGYPIASVTDVVPKADATVPEQPTISEQAIREKKKPKKIILIISLIIVFLAIVAGIWVFGTFFATGIFAWLSGGHHEYKPNSELKNVNPYSTTTEEIMKHTPAGKKTEE